MQHKTVYLLFCKFTFQVSTTTIIKSTQNCNYSIRYWSYFLCSYLPPSWPGLATLEGGSCTVPEAVFTVLYTPDDGCGWQPKHVEWTSRIISRLLCVTSRWTVNSIIIQICGGFLLLYGTKGGLSQRKFSYSHKLHQTLLFRWKCNYLLPDRKCAG